MPQPDPSAPRQVTLNPERLVADKTNTVEWFPTRVCDLLHEAGGFGHQSGICHACTAIYTAINVVLGEVDDDEADVRATLGAGDR